MTGAQIFVWLAALCVTVFATALSALRPLDILRVSLREAARLCRRPRVTLFAFVQFLWPAAAPWAALQLTHDPVGVLALLFLAQALSVALLAHVAFRLHRRLILGEWREGVTFGRCELRMSAYVVVAWSIVTLIRQIPAPAAFSPEIVAAERAVIFAVTFASKMALALVGPAASLADSRPMRRSALAAWREPAGLFALAATPMLVAAVAGPVLAAVGAQFDAGVLSSAVLVLIEAIAATALFLTFEFAAAIVLTRTFEDTYETDTRSAEHNRGWL